MSHTSRSMTVVAISMTIIGLVSTGAMAETYVYDYSNVPMVSPFPGDLLDGQDNWLDGLQGGQSARNDLDHVPGIMGGNAYYAPNGAQAGRLNDAEFSYAVSGDALTLEYVGRIQQFSLTSFALAYDVDGDGFIFGEEGSGEVAFQFGVAADQWYIRAADFGEELTSEPLGLGGSGHTWRMVLEADLAANGGDGSGSLFVQQLGDTSNNTVDDALNPVEDLQDVNLRLLDLDGPSADPANWDAIFTVLGAGNMDDLTIITGDGLPRLQAGDANQDLQFDQLDLVQVQIAAKYLTGQAATWGEGDWDGAPGGTPGEPPEGNGLFDQLDIIAALNAGTYLTGPYQAIGPATQASNGESFGTLGFADAAQTGLGEQFVQADLTVVDSLAGGVELGEVDLVYVPEPSTLISLALGLTVVVGGRKRRINRSLSQRERN